MSKFDIERFSDLLRQDAGLSINPAELRFLKGTGLNHDHIVLGDSGWLARIPRGNSGMSSQDYLSQQEALYSAAAPSLHTPELLAAIAPADDLPHGALIVQRIEYVRKADFGRDYRAIAASLAAIHATEPPPALLPGPTAPGESQRGFIEAMLVPSLDSAELNPRSRALLNNALDQCYDDLSRMARSTALPTGFIASDTHPGNFLIDRQGKAWMPDLEYATVDCPLVDTAMAVCPLARQFDPDSNPSAPVGTGQKFFAAWLDLYSQDHHDAARRALIDMRPAMGRVALVGSLGWLAFWQTQGQATMTDVPTPTANNWSRMVSDYLEPEALGTTLRQNGFGASALKHFNRNVGFQPGAPAI